MTEENTNGQTKIAWRCKVCGFVIEVDELPDDYVCPVCGAPRAMFEKIEIPA